jgi:4-hydroxybenzoate polyprenyltransferase
MLAICIPFDIRDISIDAAENVSTLPHKLGEKITRNLALIFTLIYCLLIIGEYIANIISMPSLIALLVSMSVTFVLILFSSSKRNEYYYVAGIDGTMILQGVLMIIAGYYSSL